MPTPDVAGLARVLANRWSAAREAPVAVRLTLPHLVLLANQARTTVAGMDRVAQQLLATDPSTADRAAMDESAIPQRVASALNEHTSAITAALRAADTRPSALLEAWDAAAAQFDPGSDGGLPGHDAAGRPWMPVLGGINPGLPLTATYRRLGTTGPAGHAAQLLLFALAGEAGYQRLLTDVTVLAAHTACTRDALAIAAWTLDFEGWIARERWEANDGAFPRILWIAEPRQHDVFRGLGAVSRG